MVALIIVFLTGLLCLFIAFTKKPWMVLLTASVGLTAAGVNLVCQWFEPSQVLLSYKGVVFDQFAIGFSIIAVFFTLLLIVSGYESFKKNLDHTGDYMALLIFSLFGALCMVSFTDMFMFFLGLEVLSIPIYVMAGSRKGDIRSSEASLKYFMTGAFATGILLFGIAWIYGATGSFKIEEIGAFIANAETPSSLVYVGLLMVMSAFLFKVGAAPFHFWSPDVYDGAPSIVTGFMAAVVKLAAFGAFIKLFSICFGTLHAFWAPALIGLSLLTMFVGNLSAIRQIRFKRLLAYSSIAHVGYALITIITMKDDSAFNLWAYLFSYGFSTIALITVAVIVNDDEDRIEAFKGLSRRNPFTAFVAVLALLSLAGVPPLMGFFGKYLVFADAIRENPALVAVALLNSGIGIYYYLRMVILILQKPEIDAPIIRKHQTPLLQMIVLAICAIALMFGGNMLIF